MIEEEIAAEKKRLRAEFSTLRQALPKAEREALSRAICERVAALPAFREADMVLLYAPVRGEVDVWPLFDRAIALGKWVALPKVIDDGRSVGRMEFYALESRDSLAKGAYGIPEPRGKCRRISRNALAAAGRKVLMAVPGLAFDRQGFRMGYGGGYYDRYLASFRGITVGVVYGALLRERLPTGPHDLRMQRVVSERETLAFD